MITLFSFIAWHLGFEGFIIIGYISTPDWISYSIAYILLLLNICLFIGFVLNIYNWKVLYGAIPLVLMSAIGSIWLPAFLFTGPLPAVVMVGYIAVKKLGKWAYFRLGIHITVVLMFQLLCSITRGVDLCVYASFYQAIRLSIDNALLFLLLYLIGGVYAHGHRLEYVVFPRRIRNERTRDESCKVKAQTSESFLGINRFEKWIMKSVILVVQILQWMFILWVANLDNLFFDALIITTSFICHGMIISQRKHLKPIILCTLTAAAMFYVAARFTIPFYISQFFPVLIGLMLVYTMYRVSLYFEQVVERKLLEDIERLRIIEQKLDRLYDYYNDDLV